jgi:O-antigen/teichoic acid export membrane protein
MSLKKNIAASYASQAYATVIGIVIIPLYLKYMGAEAYGLVGFFAMLQAWFTLLDMGLTPTMARETARLRGGAIDAQSYHRLLHALQIMFLAIALCGGGALFCAAGTVAHHWLKVQHLAMSEVIYAIRMMALIVALRWMAGLYRGIVSGSERLVWMGAYNACTATARSLGVLPVLLYVGGTPVVFFTYQFAVAVLEFACLYLKARSLLPVRVRQTEPSLTLTPIKAILKFSITIALTSSIWTMVTQADKLILSKLLPLSDYGYFSLAVLVASGVTIVSGPVSSAIMPRMARLEAEGNAESLLRIYRNSTQLVTIVALSAAVTLSLYAKPLITVWTGNAELASRVAPILVPYALGNAVLALCAFPYYLQYAKGNLRLHLIGSLLFLLLLVPAVMWVAPRYGGMGAGYVWLAVNSAFFLFWVPYVHKVVQPGIHRAWMMNDVLRIAVILTVVSICAAMILPQTYLRIKCLAEIVSVGSVALFTGTLASSNIRSGLLGAYLSYRKKPVEKRANARAIQSSGHDKYRK